MTESSDKLDSIEIQVYTEAVSKVSPAIAEMIKRKDSGEITIFFHEGKFKRAKKTVTV
jgi:hypothetical protein